MSRIKTPKILRVYLHLKEAQKRIRDSDLLLFRRRGFIAIAGRGEHNHAAKAVWWENDLFCLEVIWYCGGRAVTLASQVKQNPGRIDVYQANPHNRWPDYDRQQAVRIMRKVCGQGYGYFGVIAATLLHLPIVRWFVHPDIDDRAIDRRPPFCSQACAMADRLTEPADLARSSFYQYKFTLIP